MGIISTVLAWRYLILIPFASLGGQMFAFVCGTLIRYGYLNPFITYGVFVAGDLIPDAAYYYLGRRSDVARFIRRWGLKLGITAEHFDTIRRLWDEHTLKTMFAAKYSTVLVVPLLMSAGLTRLPPRRYFSAALAVTILQYLIFLPLGYYFASAFGEISNILEAVRIGIVILVLFVLFYLFAGRFRPTWFTSAADQK